MNDTCKTANRENVVLHIKHVIPGADPIFATKAINAPRSHNGIHTVEFTPSINFVMDT